MPLFWVNNDGDGGEDSTPDAGRTDSSNGMADNERRGVRSHAANQASELKDKDGNDESGLEGDVLVCFAP